MIKGLNGIKSSFDLSINGLEENDFIIEPTDHQKLFSNVDNVINLLQANSCNDENCIMLERFR